MNSCLLKVKAGSGSLESDTNHFIFFIPDNLTKETNIFTLPGCFQLLKVHSLILILAAVAVVEKAGLPDWCLEFATSQMLLNIYIIYQVKRRLCHLQQETELESV